MNQLLNTTLIIPIKIDSKDRWNNLNYNLTYLNHNFYTNIFIYEQGYLINAMKEELINKFKNIKFSFMKEQTTGFFHKTKYLNKMLDKVETPVVCCYDVDTVFETDIYMKCEKMILEKEFDMIYPFGKGYYQIEVLKEADKTVFLNDPKVKNILSKQKNFINFSPFLVKYAEYGHAVFLDTKKYQSLGGENENYLSWGPEDKERFFKFKRLGLNITWLDNLIYHFDHERKTDSDYTNPHFEDNNKLFNLIEQMDNNFFLEYYKNQAFYKEYNNIRFQLN